MGFPNLEISKWAAALGENGYQVCTTGTFIGPFKCISVVNDCIFSKLDSITRKGTNTIAGGTIAAGINMFGSFATIYMVNGTVIAYY